MINTKTNDFLTSLTQLVNEAELPPCIVRMGLELARAQVVQKEVQAVVQEAQAARGKEVAKDE